MKDFVKLCMKWNQFRNHSDSLNTDQLLLIQTPKGPYDHGNVRKTQQDYFSAN